MVKYQKDGKLDTLNKSLTVKLSTADDPNDH